MLENGTAVRSTNHYATQFPDHILKNGGRPLKGVVRRLDRRGNIVVKWVQFQTEMHLSPEFVEVDPSGDKREG